MKNLFAYTALESSYPGFVSINQDENGCVSVTVRSAPEIKEGVYICVHQDDFGPGKCTPGGPTCNNYCNLAPEKGPMQDAPLTCIQTFEGKQASFTLPAEASGAFIASLSTIEAVAENGGSDQ